MMYVVTYETLKVYKCYAVQAKVCNRCLCFILIDFEWPESKNLYAETQQDLLAIAKLLVEKNVEITLSGNCAEMTFVGEILNIVYACNYHLCFPLNCSLCYFLIPR